MSEKRPKNGQKWPKCAQFVSNRPKTKNEPYLGLCGSKPNSEGTYPTRKPPLFVVSKPQNRPTSHLDPRTSGHLVQPEGSTARARLGPTVGPPGSPGRKKSFFSKLFLDHLGCSNKCFLAFLSPWWRVLGHGKSQNALKRGRFKTKNGSKNGSKTRFSKSDLRPFGVPKQVFLAPFEPAVMRFGPWKIPKRLENEPFWDIYICIYIYISNILLARTEGQTSVSRSSGGI